MSGCSGKDYKLGGLVFLFYCEVFPLFFGFLVWFFSLFFFFPLWNLKILYCTIWGISEKEFHEPQTNLGCFFPELWDGDRGQQSHGTELCVLP